GTRSCATPATGPRRPARVRGRCALSCRSRSASRTKTRAAAVSYSTPRTRNRRHAQPCAASQRAELATEKRRGVTGVAEAHVLLRLAGGDAGNMASDAAGTPRPVKIRLLMCAAALLAAAAAPAPGASSDACTLLDAAQLSTLLGVALEPGRHVMPGA